MQLTDVIPVRRLRRAQPQELKANRGGRCRTASEATTSHGITHQPTHPHPRYLTAASTPKQANTGLLGRPPDYTRLPLARCVGRAYNAKARQVGPLTGLSPN